MGSVVVAATFATAVLVVSIALAVVLGAKLFGLY